MTRIEELKKEFEELSGRMNQIERAKNETMTRMIEIQGALKELEPKKDDSKKEVRAPKE